MRPPLKAREIPEIVHVVLDYVAKQRRSGGLSARLFRKKLTRLRREEFEPRGLVLTIRALPHGGTRYLVKDESGSIRQTFDCPSIKQG